MRKVDGRPVPGKRPNPNSMKVHRSYTIAEVAARLGVSKGTVRNWQRAGLKPNADDRPLLFQGAAVRTFLRQRNANRKRPCPPGMLFCFRCRDPRRPASGKAVYVGRTAESGNLKAACEVCGATMHRSARRERLSVTMPQIEVQVAEALLRFNGSPPAPLNCNLDKESKA